MEIDDGKGNFSFDGTEPDNDVDEPENEVADDFTAEHTWSGHGQPDLDMFDNLTDFDTAVEKFEQQEQEFQAGIIPEIVTPPPSDDEHGHKRRGFFKELETYDRERALAEASGDTEAVRRWDERAAMTARSLNKLPPNPEVEHARQKQSDMMQNAVSKLFSKEMRYDSLWGEKDTQRDMATLVADFNRQATKSIVVPEEVGGKFGNIATVTPQNVYRFDLNEEEMSRYQAQVAGTEGSDPDSHFKATWSWLHSTGLASEGVRAVPLGKQKKQSAKEAGQKPISHMTMKEYTAWRESGGGR